MYRAFAHGVLLAVVAGACITFEPTAKVTSFVTLAPGATGGNGAEGPSGVSGNSGATGPSGVSGDSGVSGVSGDSGATGSSGVSGDSGATGPTMPTGPADNGASCSMGNDCKSTVCAGGVCCDRACGGQCQSCATGTCANVTGQPAAPKALCNGSGACAGTCNGGSADCSYPIAGTVCGASCNGLCDGSGTCNSGGGSCVNGFACGPSGCLSACNVPSDCQPNFTCNTGAHTCQRVPEADCLNGSDDNGDGLADCADPTCFAIVECVSAPAGGELGVHVASGATCPSGYAAGTGPYFSDLSNSSCGDCSACSSQCVVSFNYGVSCGLAFSSASTSATSSTGTQCLGLGSAGITSGQVAHLDTPGAMTCTGSGTASPPTTSFNSNKYCVATQSQTCGLGQACVNKSENGTLCTRLPAGTSCPVGYATSQKTYYESMTTATCKTSCAGAPCNPGRICNVTAASLWVNAGCASGASVAISTSCITTSTTYNNASVTLSFDPTGVGFCVASPGTTAASGQTASQLCCE